MPCPHLSKANGDCFLQQDPGPDTDDGREPEPAESVDRELCLGPGQRYRDCPILTRFLAELVP